MMRKSAEKWQRLTHETNWNFMVKLSVWYAAGTVLYLFLYEKNHEKLELWKI